MILSNRNLSRFISIFICVLLSQQVNAGIFKILLNAGQEAAEVGAKAGRKIDIDAPSLTHLPDEPGVSKAGLIINSDGSLGIKTDTGGSITFNQGDDLVAIKQSIKKSQLTGAKVKDVKFYLSADDFFVAKNNPLLKEIDGLNITYKDKSFPLQKTIGSAKTSWQVKARENLLVDIDSYTDLKSSLFRLDSSINLANMRLVSFSTKAEGFPSQVQVASKYDLPDVTTINPDYLETSLNILKNQSLVITGKRVGNVLKIKGLKDKESSIDIIKLQNEASKNNVNLLILDSNSSAQPGSKSLLWNKNHKQKQLEVAFSATTEGDFINAFASKNQPIEFSAGTTADNYVSFKGEPKKAAAPSIDKSAEIGLGMDIVSHVAAHMTLKTVLFYSRSENYEKELSNRIIPGVPSIVTTLYLVNIFSGIWVWIFGLSIWKRIWKKYDRDDYDNWLKYALQRITYYFSFIFGLLGLIGLPLLMIRGCMWLYQIYVGLMHVLTWPFRFIFGLFRRKPAA